MPVAHVRCLLAMTRTAVPARGHRFAPLDGLRGLAVAAVIAFHSGISWAVGASVWLEAFFVLSGFLITLLLMQERTKTGRIALGRFYARRVLRLYPALLLMVLAVLIYAAIAPNPVGTQRFGSVITGSLLYVTDIQAASHHLPVLALTEHTWSLAIEEQFYLIWPPLLVLLLACGLRLRGLLTAVLGLAAFSAVLPMLLWSGPGSLNRVYYGPDTRGQSLLLGCALGLITHAGRLPTGRQAVRVGQLFGFAGAAAIVVYSLYGSYRNAWNYTGFGLTLMGLSSVAVVAAAMMMPNGPIARFLALRPLVATGRISYGLYLWHWPIFLVLNSAYLGRGFVATQIIRVTVTVIAASLSYRFVEKPCLRLRHRFDPPVRVPAPAASKPATHPV